MKYLIKTHENCYKREKSKRRYQRPPDSDIALTHLIGFYIGNINKKSHVYHERGQNHFNELWRNVF